MGGAPRSDMANAGVQKPAADEPQRSSSTSSARSTWCFGCCFSARGDPSSMKQTAARSVETKSGTGLTPPPLPSEWREVPDPAGSGDVYYWNIETDAVMWEHPATVAGKALV